LSGKGTAADGLLVGVRRSWQLGQQPDRRHLDMVGVERVEAVLIEGRDRAHPGRQHSHRVRLARERLEEAAHLLVQQGVVADRVGEFGQLVGGG
jgi:hypothetical protein